VTVIPDLGDMFAEDPAPSYAPPAYEAPAAYQAPVQEARRPRRAPEPAAAPAPAKREAIEYPADYDAPVDPHRWLDETIRKCQQLNASDLLLNTSPEGELTASARVDGRMRPMSRVKGPGVQIIIGKFKAAANLASGGSFRPQETIHEIRMGDDTMGKARVALFRKADRGEAIVMRLPPQGALRRLDELDFSPLNYSLVTNMLAAANRMILFAGPMGSGKTTSSQGALDYVASGTRTVWTIEDPVERKIDGLIQLEVDEENDAGFADLLPFLVRSDYDTLFLGEIRDKATAAAGVRQAKAGRQVITTIHANDNITAILRLIELAEDSPLSVMDSVRGVISQRLVGKLNPHWDPNRDPHWDKYKGRVPIHEVLTVSDELTEAVMSGAPLSEVKAIALKNSPSTFMLDAERLINAGVTDEEEVRRVLGE
jgi:type II secretory ATPase GspE/PulE/Tfp pilus assembly ATPase PilB-like protein